MPEIEKQPESVMPPVDALATVQVTVNRLEASVILSPPQYGGAPVTLELLQSAIAKKGVVFGVDQARLQALADEPVYGEFVVIAEGKPPENGEDAKLNYYVRLQSEIKPKENPDGSVDFKDLGLIEYVEQGTLLCDKTPLTQGTPGSDVLGAPLAAKPGKDISMPVGKNTVLSEDKLKLHAGIGGQADYVNKKINVLNTYTVEDDVSTATGNIQFMGNVVVMGGVAAGFNVQASGNIDIHGVVESAHITAGGSIIVRGGFNGGAGGVLDAGANITCRYIQGGRVTLGGNLETSYIINTTVQCGGSVNLVGKGLIVGGHIAARTSVTANTLGSATSHAATIIETGSDPLLVKRSVDIPKELEVCKKNIRSLEPLTTALIQLKALGRLTPDKAANLEKSKHALELLKIAQVNLEDEYAEVQQQLADLGSGFVRVLKSAYPGVKIIIGAEQFPLQKDYTFTRFSRNKGESIAIGPAR
ncbi:MAG: FapA family protein [Oscillospiraceae bacterium]|nr:FapA family protein [Oscillospiraceae bacterium]